MFKMTCLQIPRFISSFFSKIFPSGGTPRGSSRGNVVRNLNGVRNQQLPFGSNQREACLALFHLMIYVNFIKHYLEDWNIDFLNFI